MMWKQSPAEFKLGLELARQGRVQARAGGHFLMDPL